MHRRPHDGLLLTLRLRSLNRAPGPPFRNFYGTVNFTYEITDPLLPGSAATAVVTLMIPSPGGPKAVDDAYPCPFNAPCQPPAQGGVLGNDNSLAGGTVTATRVVAQPAVGTVSITPDGNFTFMPPL
jgi:hypothetical protein